VSFKILPGLDKNMKLVKLHCVLLKIICLLDDEHFLNPSFKMSNSDYDENKMWNLSWRVQIGFKIKLQNLKEQLLDL